MSTQDSGGTPHTCKAVEHCHTLNERVSDLEGWLRLVDGAAQAVSARLTELVIALDRDRAAARRSAVVHCSTCTCGATR